MKKIGLALFLCVGIAFAATAQHYKKDGTPDMRYKENKETYGTGSNYSAPKQHESNSSYGSGYENSQHERVSGYDKKDGTHVDSYERTSPNDKKSDNYSTDGNYNPYTGQKGYKKPE